MLGLPAARSGHVVVVFLGKLLDEDRETAQCFIRCPAACSLPEVWADRSGTDRVYGGEESFDGHAGFLFNGN